MKDLLEISCGLDIHKEKIVACILTGPLGKPTHSEIREFTTLIPDMIALRDWIISENCHHIAMESTGIYWMPIYEILEDASWRHHPTSCKCTPYEERSWQKDRYAGFRMDFHLATRRTPERKFYSRKKNSGIPRSKPLP